MSHAFEDEPLERPEPHSGIGAAQRALDIVTSARVRGSSAATRLANQFTDGLDMGDGVSWHAEDPVGGSAARLRALRRDAELALEGVFDVLRGAIDTATGYLKRVQPVDASIESIEVSAWRGVTANAPIWVHNLTLKPWKALVPRVSGLTALDGEAFAGCVSFDPALVASLEPGQSVGAVLSVTPALRARPGDYHGLVVLIGAREVQPLHVRLSVQA